MNNKLKSLLLGSVVGLVAVTGAQAADMPAAEPVEYVKVCDTFGIGYWYIPGTDTCLKFGGYVRAQVAAHMSDVGDSFWTGNPMSMVTDGSDTQADTFSMYARGLIYADARTETGYGTLRSFVQFRGTAYDQDNPSAQLDLAFLQFAGFTAGLAPSFLDFATNGFFGDQIGDSDHDTVQVGYTYQFGGGVSLSAALESGDRGDMSGSTLNNGPLVKNDPPTALDGAPEDPYGDDAYYGAAETRTEVPDVTIAARINQGWGEAMLGGVIRQVKGRAQGVDLNDPTDPTDDVLVEEDYHEFGWAINGGVKVNLPMIEKGDYVILRGAYGEGAHRYVINDLSTTLAAAAYQAAGRTRAVSEVNFSGDVGDGTGKFDTLSAWSVYGGFTHFWTPALRSNLVGSYAGGDLEVDGTDWSVVTASGNLVWSPVKNLDVGLEVLYSYRDFDDKSALALTGKTEDGGTQDAWGAIFRLQRNFGN